MASDSSSPLDYFTNNAPIPKGSIKAKPRDWKGEMASKESNRTRTKPLVAEALTVLDDYDFKNYTYVVKDSEKTQDRLTTPGKIRRRKLTKLQQATAKYMLMGYNKSQARLKAGYSVVSARHVSRKIQGPIDDFIENFKQKFEKRGITDDFIADQFKDWFAAEKVVATKQGPLSLGADYKTRMDAYDRYKDLMYKNKAMGTKKREMVLTEWISEDGDKSEQEQQG